MHRNPGSSIDFSSSGGLIKDVGRDGDGVYRHISRDLRIPDFLSKGDFSSLSWPLVCRCLPAQNAEDQVEANIIDTVIINDAEAKLYLYTTSEGYIAQKPRNMHDLRRIRDQFMNYVAVLQPDQHLYVAVMSLQGGESKFIPDDVFSNLCLGATPKNLEMLQCFLPSKGDIRNNATYQTDYWLDRSAHIMMRTERVGLGPSLSGSSHISSRSNMDRKLNAVMETWTQKIANRIQAVHGTRVVRMTLEFVQDMEGKVWLVRSTECLMSSRPVSTRESLSPQKLKQSRTEAAVLSGQESSRGSDRVSISPPARPSSIGRHSDARISRRRQREDEFNSLNTANESMESFYQEESSVGGSFFCGVVPVDAKSSQTVPDIGRLPGSRGRSREASEEIHDFLTEVPNSRLGKEVPMTEVATAMFGSTQLRGCQGDFCDVRVDLLEDPSITGGRQASTSLSKFRRRLMEADTSQFGTIEDSSFGSTYEELDNAAATSIILGSVVSRNSTEKKRGKRKKTTRINSEEPPRLHHVDDKARLIPYRAIIQARQEMPLVKALLLRRKNKESGDYATSDTYQDLAVSGKLPAVYYTEVPCCSNCSKVYQIIDIARNKALQKIARMRTERRIDDPLLVMQLAALSTSIGQNIPSASTKSPITLSTQKIKRSMRGRDVSTSLSHEMDFEGSINGISTGGKSLSSSGSVWPEEIGDVDRSKSKASPNSLGYSATSYEKKSKASLLVAAEAIEGLTKLDVAELRSMQKPPAAVEVVLEAVMGLLTGRLSSFNDTKRLLGGGEAFLTMLREFRLDDVTDSRLQMVEPYVDNPVFRPENVLPVSACAAKFCSWVLGVVQAARWQRYIGHQRTDLLPRNSDEWSKAQRILDSNSLMTTSVQSIDDGHMTFVEKLEMRKANRKRNVMAARGNPAQHSPELKKNKGSYSEYDISRKVETALEPDSTLKSRHLGGNGTYPISREEPGPLMTRHRTTATSVDTPNAVTSSALTLRERSAVQAAQKQATERLASQNKSGGGIGISKEFRCRDGITKMPYIILGNLSIEVKRCNFVIIHDFFDTCDGTAIALKPISQRHEGCQILCFNYPGQAGTVWSRPSAVERKCGAREPPLNNDWIADRLHELLQGTEQIGDILLTNPFHIVGIGNGAAIAAAFTQRWGSDPLYSSSIRSVVSINGFLYPDPQLSAILHSASQLFETTPHSRPDIPVTYWAKYLFSDDYLNRVNPNLALNIHTAVANPITNDGRTRIARGCLQHRDMRGGLAPDYVPKVQDNFVRGDSESEVLHSNVCVPIIVLQSTENSLVNPSNVDSFLVGRSAKHLWSHQQNIISSTALAAANDASGQWVGKLSKCTEDYAKFSILGKNGLRMLLESIENPRGAFVMWSRAGHALMQEKKCVVLDLLDALCCPTADYFGIHTAQQDRNRFNQSTVGALSSGEVKRLKAEKPAEDDILFKLTAPKGISDEEETNLQRSSADVEVNNCTTPLENDHSSELQGNICNAATTASVDAVTMDVDEDLPASPLASSNNHSLLAMPVITDVCAKPEIPSGGSVRKENNTHPQFPPVIKLNPIVSEVNLAASAAVRDDLTRFTDLDDIVSTRDQRLKKKWSEAIPEAKSSIELERELEIRHRDIVAKEALLKDAQILQADARISRIQQEQANRRQAYENEDAALLEKLEADLQERRVERAAAERQRKIELANIEKKFVKEGLVQEYVPPEGETGPLPEMRPQMFTKPPDLPPLMKEEKGPISTMEQLINDEEIARKKGILSLEEFDRVKKEMALSQLEREQKLRDREDEEELAFWSETAITIQRVARGVQGRERALAVKKVRDTKITVEKGILQFQALIRGISGRERARYLKKLKLQDILLGASVVKIQCLCRSFLSRKYVRMLRRRRAAINIQRTFRGHLGLAVVTRERTRLEIIRRKNLASSKIQSIWRMKVAKEEFRGLRIHALAVIEIQRNFRGYLGRKKMNRRRKWESAAPGPERIKLGLQLIEESKVAFERQQEEIDALHRAQERAEARVSHIHAELKDSEKELVVLERELQEIDQIERDLQNLTHERDLITRGIRDAAGVARSAEEGNESTILGKPPGVGVADMTPEQQRRLKADAYALEMTIQIKRAEREKKRQELESEFATVFHDVEKKKQALERLEAALVDMESTRERKDREFRRLQQNLMQLLMEQKLELDSLREKGIELETATATSAAAATATAMKAKEHEKRSTAMFSQTEELMKFQFMSMSLSYFSSLNMLKQLRDMNADTTSAAVTSSAEAAAAAATSAVAANLPNIKKLDIKGADYVKLSAKKKKDELAIHEKAEKEVKLAKKVVMPNNVRMWTVDDVSKWMESLSLGQYAEAFREATVDGPFLLELREEDLVQVLGVSHKLHVRKILVSREKLKPLSEQEISKKEQVEYEGKADERRRNLGVPDLDTVFSQARNGRTKRLEESLNLGFPINGEDGKGNTLLLIACQNSNKRMVEMLVTRGANVNHQNAVGNSALHFSMSFDPDGQIGEYLIAHGADDTLENIEGLTPYDGLGTAGGNF